MSTTKPGLQLPVMAMSLVVPVAAFHNQPGCLGEFLRKWVRHPSGLVNFSAMSGGDLQKQADALHDHLGLTEGVDYAAIDGMSGPWVEHPAVRFVDPEKENRSWFAYLVEEEEAPPVSR